MTEARIQRKIQEALRKRGAFVFKTQGSRYVQGIPDLIACYYGLFVAFEVKTPERPRNVSKLQLEKIRQIEEAHGLARVVTSVEEAMEALDELEDEAA